MICTRARRGEIDRASVEPGRDRFQGFPRLVFQRFLSTRANRSDPFVRPPPQISILRATIGTPTLWGQWRAALNSLERKAESRESIIWIEESLILSAVLCKTRRKMPDANVRIRIPSENAVESCRWEHWLGRGLTSTHYPSVFLSCPLAKLNGSS